MHYKGYPKIELALAFSTIVSILLSKKHLRNKIRISTGTFREDKAKGLKNQVLKSPRSRSH